ncbi:MAG: hypothetical protein IT336_04430 [Thermomicrobiales bacterium]|nr:hypothetical protein [Thermomicrobiales bacterium]
MRPRFSLTTAGFALTTMSGFVEMANRLGAEGLDLDATSWSGRASLRPDRLLSDGAFPVSSIWITPADADALGRESAFRSRFQSIGASAIARGLRIVIRLPAGSEAGDDRAVMAVAARALETCEWISGIVIAVPALAPEGGRAHLSRIRTLRRLVEEWELEIGLDLVAQTDNRWEAEAAVQIVGPRLALVRLRAPLSIRTTDVHVRTIRACAEDGFAGILSLAPVTPFWLSWHRSSVIRDLTANRDAINLAYRDCSAPIGQSRPTSLR